MVYIEVALNESSKDRKESPPHFYLERKTSRGKESLVGNKKELYFLHTSDVVFMSIRRTLLTTTQLRSSRKIHVCARSPLASFTSATVAFLLENFSSILRRGPSTNTALSCSMYGTDHCIFCIPLIEGGTIHTHIRRHGVLKMRYSLPTRF